jgi:predicted transglutaminase-like cysteine proteinase
MGKALRIGALTALLISASPSANEPFGVATVPAPDGPISAIWQELQSAMRTDELTVVACRAEPACGSPDALRFIAIVDEAMQYQGRARVGHINRAVNQAIEGSHRDVPWMSPLKALASPGDCKSYAVTKYAALGDAGIAPDDRRLVIIWNRAHPQETHLIVVVRVALQWLILDDTTEHRPASLRASCIRSTIPGCGTSRKRRSPMDPSAKGGSEKGVSRP